MESTRTGVFDIKAGAEKFPLMVVVSSSYVCNSKCPGCPYTQSNLRDSYRDAPFIQPDIFKKVADECGEHGSWLRITGGGEPLLHPQMIGLIGYAKLRGAKVGLITNGSLLTPARTLDLVQTGIDAIDISADAADKETYARVRTGLNFDKLVRQVQFLVDVRRHFRKRTQLKIIVSIVNQKAIAGRLDEAVAFWSKIVDNVQVRKYLTWGVGDASMSADTVPLSDDNTPCPFPFERIVVDSRGTISLCSYDIKGETDFGNVAEHRIADIWRGERLELVRQGLRAGDYGKLPLCRDCADRKYRSWDFNYWNVLKQAATSSGKGAQ